MYNPLKLQSPVILPPESISQNWISKENFDLKENLTFSFKLKSSNTSDKELGFSIFLVNSSPSSLKNDFFTSLFHKSLSFSV